MVQRTWTNVTLQSTGSFAPNAAGWDLSALPSFSSVDAKATLPAVALNDATLIIACDIEYTNDPTGATGWAILSGGVWQGGPGGRDHTAKQPAFGPYTTTAWPPLKRLRFHVVPSRDVPNVDGVVTAA